MTNGKNGAGYVTDLLATGMRTPTGVKPQCNQVLARRVRLAVILLALPACSNPAGTTVTEPPTVLTPPPDVVAASSSVPLLWLTVRAEAHAWRDLEPGMPGPRGLIVGARLESENGAALPGDIVIEHLWVVRDGQAWRATPRIEQPPAHPGELPVVARDGPEWTGRVDVVLQVRTASGERIFVARRGLDIVLAL